MPTYDPKQVKILLDGALISGYADGTFVNIEFNNDAYSLLVGADGESVRSKSNDRSAKITFTLLPTSRANAILDAFQKTDRLTNLGRFAISIVDMLTGTNFLAPAAWVVKDPGQDFQKEAQAKTWVCETASCETTHLGSLDIF